MRKKVIASLVLNLFINYVYGYSKPVCFIDQHDNLLKDIEGELHSYCRIVNHMYNFSSYNEDEAYLDGVTYPLFDRNDDILYKEKFTFIDRKINNQAFLNVTISDFQFNRMRVRIENSIDSFHWQTVEFNSSLETQELSLLFPVVQDYKTKIEFYADKGNYKFYRRYQFIAPPKYSGHISEFVFVYLDTTYSDKVHLYIQPLPDELNISRYEVSFEYVKKDISSERIFFNLTEDQLHCEQEKFSDDTQYKFIIKPVNANGERLALTSIEFEMSTSHQKLIIMMVGIFVVPIIICFAFYLLYSYCKYRESRRMRDPNCLLVYSPTHDSHVSVMVKLAEYLRACRINIMIDVLDIPKDPYQNPGNWCNKAFQRANTIVVAASPPLETNVTVTIYRDLDKRAYKLIHENRRWLTKEYLTIQLPYCKEGNLPGELCTVRPLDIPKQLKKLVNKIHRMKYTELYDTPDPKELVQCIEMARRDILYGECNSKSNCLEELTEIILPKMNEKISSIDHTDSSNEETDIIDDKIEYATNLETLKL